MSISFLGTYLIYSALAIALTQCLLPLYGYWKNNHYLLALARPCALLQAFLVSSAFLLLIFAFLSNDFSLAYVAQNSHASLPFLYRLVSLWGAHEGSFLLWIFVLNVWTLFLCFFSRNWDKALSTLSLSLIGLISFCFLLFLAYTSNPFIITTHAEPQDLNPLLQDPGFFIHPPMLYAGYVGFSTVFAITMAHLIKEQAIHEKNWAKLIRPWVLAAWSFLTLGITLGSWWAYHVLGWGGFWFWDPVENASLLPWLAGAALLHLVIVAEKQGRFLSWAFILAILTFSLSILGTFLVRSGVLISVHSFAHDPSRGLFLLLLFGLITGGAFGAYTYRSLKRNTDHALPQLFSWSAREGILLIQSILLFIAMATVLLGILYPLIIQALGLGALSVGAPYFNQALFPLVCLGLLFMGWAPLSQWATPLTPKLFSHYSFRHLLISIMLSISLTLFFTQQWMPTIILELSLIFWAALSVHKILFRQTIMALAHIGFAIVIMSIILTSSFSKEREVRMQLGQSLDLGPYTFQFIEVKGLQGPNFKGLSGTFTVLRHHQEITRLHPEKRIYTVRKTVMTKVDIYPAIFHDLYIALGEPLSEHTWSVRLYYKPFVRWIWLGGFCIAISGFLALLRYTGKPL